MVTIAQWFCAVIVFLILIAIALWSEWLRSATYYFLPASQILMLCSVTAVVALFRPSSFHESRLRFRVYSRGIFTEIKPKECDICSSAALVLTLCSEKWSATWCLLSQQFKWQMQHDARPTELLTQGTGRRQHPLCYKVPICGLRWHIVILHYSAKHLRTQKCLVLRQVSLLLQRVSRLKELQWTCCLNVCVFVGLTS